MYTYFNSTLRNYYTNDSLRLVNELVSCKSHLARGLRILVCLTLCEKFDSRCLIYVRSCTHSFGLGDPVFASQFNTHCYTLIKTNLFNKE